MTSQTSPVAELCLSDKESQMTGRSLRRSREDSSSPDDGCAIFMSKFDLITAAFWLGP